MWAYLGMNLDVQFRGLTSNSESTNVSLGTFLASKCVVRDGSSETGGQ